MEAERHFGRRLALVPNPLLNALLADQPQVPKDQRDNFVTVLHSCRRELHAHIKRSKRLRAHARPGRQPVRPPARFQQRQQTSLPFVPEQMRDVIRWLHTIQRLERRRHPHELQQTQLFHRRDVVRLCKLSRLKRHEISIRGYRVDCRISFSRCAVCADGSFLRHLWFAPHAGKQFSDPLLKSIERVWGYDAQRHGGSKVELAVELEQRCADRGNVSQRVERPRSELAERVVWGGGRLAQLKKTMRV
mmetsp:Transcript_2364/g.5306  ORF Transcript_2364/g.5306 Transcript_2364/m.5306 type:complete len:247 (-) Transcript_2364:705-1445(-)